MSEMLGNKYFQSRNYSMAASTFSKVYTSDPHNLSVRKKMIICFTQTGELSKAFDFFYALVKENIKYIINTDLVGDDCPCEELANKYGKILPYEANSNDLKLLLGMLWLYCDVDKSLSFFTQLELIQPNKKKYSEIIFEIKNYLNSVKLNHH
jgi:tetratricopeptide (TPR) repeat protein